MQQAQNDSALKLVMILCSFSPETIIGQVETYLEYFKSFAESAGAHQVRVCYLLQIFSESCEKVDLVITTRTKKNFAQLEQILETFIKEQEYALVKNSLQLLSVITSKATGNIAKIQQLFQDCFKHLLFVQHVLLENPMEFISKDYKCSFIRSLVIVTVLSMNFPRYLLQSSAEPEEARAAEKMEVLFDRKRDADPPAKSEERGAAITF